MCWVRSSWHSEGSSCLNNVQNYLHHDKAPHPRRFKSPVTLLYKPQIVGQAFITYDPTYRQARLHMWCTHPHTYNHTAHSLFSCMLLLYKVNDVACLAMFLIQNRTCLPHCSHTCAWLHLTMFVHVYTMPIRLWKVPGVTSNEFPFLPMDHGFLEW